ncbi:MAG: monofunctional biosynthetic peptidoglycan transglycosylase [Sulfuricaulis sp.]
MFGKRHRGNQSLKGFLLHSGRRLRWMFRILLLLLIVDLFYVGSIWPDWKKLATGPIPKSAFMRMYEKQLAQHKTWPRLRWQPVPMSSIPKYFARAVILAEDSRFYEHSGFDLIAFKEAMDYDLKEGRFVLGASTISQQTVKNLYLSPARNPLRKWHELILTWGMEHNLTKRRILDIYLNVAQFGQGIYGVRAASEAYWGVAPEQMSLAQAAELAASLPGPVKNNPATRSRYFERRSQKILSLLERYPGNAIDAIRERPPELLAPPPDNGNDVTEPPDNGSDVSVPPPDNANPTAPAEGREPPPDNGNDVTEPPDNGSDVSVPPPDNANPTAPAEGREPPPAADGNKPPVEDRSIPANTP